AVFLKLISGKQVAKSYNGRRIRPNWALAAGLAGRLRGARPSRYGPALRKNSASNIEERSLSPLKPAYEASATSAKCQEAKSLSDIAEQKGRSRGAPFPFGSGVVQHQIRSFVTASSADLARTGRRSFEFNAWMAYGYR
ncbi:MAG: hypothetical protein WBD71_04975, partial [Xanthobacteraceae bacterium]